MVIVIDNTECSLVCSPSLAMYSLGLAEHTVRTHIYCKLKVNGCLGVSEDRKVVEFVDL